MTYQSDFTLPSELLKQIAANGFDQLPELIRIVVNAAMQAERQQYLGAEPYQRTPERLDQANGYKPKTVKTRMGEITFDVPQVRERCFLPRSTREGFAQRKSSPHNPSRDLHPGRFHSQSYRYSGAVVWYVRICHPS